MRRLITASSALVLSIVLVLSAPAEAASFSVKLGSISDRTVSSNKKATIKPKVTVRGKATLVRKTVTVRKSGKVVVRNKTRARLRPGTYRVQSKATFRAWRWVNQTQTVRRLAYEAYDDVPSSCRITRVTGSNGDLFVDASFHCQPTRGGVDVFNTEGYLLGDGSGSWDVYVGLTDPTPTVYAASPQGLVGQTVRAAATTPWNLYTHVKQTTRVRKYGALRTKTRTQTVKVKARRSSHSSDPGSSHACTTTSSGTCIQGGQFCPQAKYGQSGYDANGRRYVCKGDHDHPHWMKP